MVRPGQKGTASQAGRAVSATRSLFPDMGRIIKLKGTSFIDAMDAVRKREGEQRFGEIVRSLDAASLVTEPRPQQEGAP
jgi:hypothetical protein